MRKHKTEVMMNDLYAMPGHLIRRVQQVAVAIFSEECTTHALTPIQFAFLTAIHNNPDVDATRLSALIGFDRSTLGDVLEPMETRGWIKRKPSPQDKRIKGVRLSTLGTKVLKSAEPEVHRVQHRLLEPITPQEQQALLSLLSKLLQHHEHMVPSAGERP